MNIFGDNLRLLRINNNLTQKELGLKMNKTEGAIGLYEQGRREVDFETLLFLSKFFKVSIDYLLGNNIDNKLDHKNNYHNELAAKINNLNTENYDKILSYVDFLLSTQINEMKMAKMNNIS